MIKATEKWSRLLLSCTMPFCLANSSAESVDQKDRSDQSFQIAEEKLGHLCYAGNSDLGQDYRTALSKMPSSLGRIIIAYPAITDEGSLNNIIYRSIIPMPIQESSKNNETFKWYVNQELIRSPYFASILYKSLKDNIGKKGSALLQPLYTNEAYTNNSPDFAWSLSDRGVARTANMLVNVRLYSFGITPRAAIEDQRHEALTMGPYITPAVAISYRAPSSENDENKPLVATRLGIREIKNTSIWSGGLPKSTMLYKSERIKLQGELWSTYLHKLAGVPNPAKTQWADALAKKLIGSRSRTLTPADMAGLGTSWASSMFGNCAADVAHHFSPETWSKITAAVLSAENQALSRWSDALYAQLIDGSYGVALRAQMDRETDAIQRYEHARASQGFMNFMSTFTALATGAIAGYAGSIGAGYSINTIQLSNQMFDMDLAYQSGTKARDSVRSSSISALSNLASATALPQMQAVTVIGADQREITVRNISELRAANARIIMSAFK